MRGKKFCDKNNKLVNKLLSYKKKVYSLSMYYFVFSLISAQFIFARISFTEQHSDEVYPFLVKIEAKGKIQDCAGTILTPCTVLTSAHCIDDVKPSDITVTHITTSVVKYNVTQTIIHPKYNSTVSANDLALLQIENNFEKPWSPVKLNNLDKEQVLLKCKFIEIVGWSGQIMKDFVKNDYLSKRNPLLFEKPMKATVNLISNENCSAVIKNFGGIFQGEEKLCGVTEESEEEKCFTGPGGPVLCSLTSKDTSESMKSIRQRYYYSNKNGTLADPIDLLESLRESQEKKSKRETKGNYENLQVGVVSWGKSCSKVPSVYVRTDFYYDWITETAGKMIQKCFIELESFTFLTPQVKNRGAPLISCGAVFNHVIFFISITVLLRLL